MCGIAGCYALLRPENAPDVQTLAEKMASTLSYRGPDDSGVWKDPDLPLALAHRRLAILDISPKGRQPMISQSSRYVITFNGEIYNFLSLRAELGEMGVSFRSRSDTEVLIAAIEIWGINQALNKVNGMFAFALWDRRLRMLHLARDRLGKKPLYVGWAGAKLAFASELKAFHALPSFHPRVAREALFLFLRHGYVSSPYTIYEGIWTVPPGCRMSFPVSSLECGSDLAGQIEVYWHHSTIVKEARQRARTLTDEQYVSEFETLLRKCVQDRMISDVPLGAFLSGGIDSSTIVALMREFSSHPVKTFTIGFQEGGFDEAKYAKRVAAHLGTEHHDFYLTGKAALEIIPRLAEIYDEPFADVSAIPTYLISCFARKQVTVALSGDGGDEMFGGYNRHFILPRVWKISRAIPTPLLRALARATMLWSPAVLDYLFFWHPQMGQILHKLAAVVSATTPLGMYRQVMSLWWKPELLLPNVKEPIIPLTDPAWQPEGLSFGEQMMYGDSLSFLPNDILVKVDRATMAVALEARAPLLDYRIFEYVWTLPENLKIRYGKSKWILRQVLSHHVPRDMIERPKQGFDIPVAAWLRGPLRDWAETILADERLRSGGYLNSAPIRQAWSEHISGQGNHAASLWAILMFETWRERWRA